MPVVVYASPTRSESDNSWALAYFLLCYSVLCIVFLRFNATRRKNNFTVFVNKLNACKSRICVPILKTNLSHIRAAEIWCEFLFNLVRHLIAWFELCSCAITENKVPFPSFLVVNNTNNKIVKTYLAVGWHNLVLMLQLTWHEMVSKCYCDTFKWRSHTFVIWFCFQKCFHFVRFVNGYRFERAVHVCEALWYCFVGAFQVGFALKLRLLVTLKVYLVLFKFNAIVLRDLLFRLTLIVLIYQF